MTPPVVRRVGLLVLGLLVVLAAIFVAGRESGDPPPAGSADSVRLGPEQGDDVAAYLARLPALLPAAGAGPVPALVQFDAELDAAAALTAVAGAQPGQVVFRVPLPRVQTALRFQLLAAAPDSAAAAREIDFARQRAEQDAARDAAARTGRAAAVATAEARALAQPCRCVLAVLVHADRATLDVIRARPGVRAVHAAPSRTAARDVALSPLLPEQQIAVTATPDDGPVSGG
ncbi:MAG: hypothetical protein ACR2GE_02975 [Pseudonocardia sp.]